MNGVPMAVHPAVAADLSRRALEASRAGLVRPVVWEDDEPTPEPRLALPGALAMHAGETEKPYDLVGRVAVIPVDGLITYGDSFWGWLFGGTTVTRLCTLVNHAAADGDVDRIALDIHSPGGQIAGMSDLEHCLRRAAARKPLHALVHDECYSGGYWAACLADEIVSTPTGGSGSIGVIVRAFDDTELYAKIGLRPVPITDQHHKAFMTGGRPLGDLPEHPEPNKAEFAEELATVRRWADKFFGLVSERRGIPADTLRGWAGKCFDGEAQVTAGLVDAIETAEAFYERLASKGPRKGQSHGQPHGASARDRERGREARDAAGARRGVPGRDRAGGRRGGGGGADRRGGGR